MSNSQEQSLDENTVFVTVPESNPEFFYCERERYALESLLSTGPDAFYAKLDKEGLDTFLSRQEVDQFSNSVQDYHSRKGTELIVDKGPGIEEPSLGVDGISTSYWPTCSDATPANLELGWPNGESWATPGSVHIYTNPPMPQAPPIREVVRRLIRGARKVIAMVTDRLTDSLVISDLCTAASLGVPVYIILNYRSAQDTNAPYRLRHQNIRVRILEGKTFCSRDGKVVTGELRESFLMVDLEKVMLGSYSPTWSDAHLHRQLVVLLMGPVVDSFDQEFRILYAASLRIPDSWMLAPPLMGRRAKRTCTHYKPYTPLNGLNDVISPPPADFIVDWESLGLTNYSFLTDEVSSLPWHWGEIPHGPPALVEKKMLVQEKLQPSGSHLWMDQSKPWHNGGMETKVQVDSQSEPMRQNHHLSGDKKEPLHRDGPLTQTADQRGVDEEGLSICSRRESVCWQGLNPECDMYSAVNKPDTKKALILSVTENEHFNKLCDVLKKLQLQDRPMSQQADSTEEPLYSNNSSLFNLRCHEEDLLEKDPQTNHVTPALTLIRQRNDEIRSGVIRAPRTFLDGNRLRSSSTSLLWERWKCLNNLDHDIKKK